MRDKIEEILNSYVLQHHEDEDGNKLRLVDVLTPLGDISITRGKEEIELLADEIAFILNMNNPNLTAQEQAWYNSLQKEHNSCCENITCSKCKGTTVSCGDSTFGLEGWIKIHYARCISKQNPE